MLKKFKSFFIRYKEFHKKIIIDIYNIILDSKQVSGRLFTIIFNLQLMLKTNNRCYFDGEKYFVKDLDTNIIYFFYEKSHRKYFVDGLEKQGIKIGNKYFLDEIKFDENDLVIDCGANLGTLKLYFLYKNIDISYIGIEPEPTTYKCLQKNVSPSKTLNIGLWNEEKTLEFFLFSKGSDSSFIKPKKFTEKIEIKTKRLDVLFPDDKIKLLKVEAEGAEPEVIAGLENILDNIEYISCDLGPERGINEETTFVPVINYLYNKGFELISVNNYFVLLKNKNKGIKYK